MGFVLVGLIGTAVVAGLLGIGIVQAAWIIPLSYYYRRMGETQTTKGLLITASVIFLLNAGCWGTVATMR